VENEKYTLYNLEYGEKMMNMEKEILKMYDLEYGKKY
jgi:hypothetical protein